MNGSINRSDISERHHDTYTTHDIRYNGVNYVQTVYSTKYMGTTTELLVLWEMLDAKTGRLTAVSPKMKKELTEALLDLGRREDLQKMQLRREQRLAELLNAN